MTFQRFANAVLRLLIKLLLDCEVDGLENLPEEGPLIAMQNHMISIDTVIGAAFIDREIMGMSKVENYSNPVLSVLFKAYGTFPVRRGEVDRQALRTSLTVLKEGKILMAAPEGTRSRSNTLQKGKDGLSYIAVKSGAPIIPVAIWGQEEFWNQLRRLRRTRVKVVFGRPFVLDPGAGKLTREQLTQMTHEMMYRIAALMPAEYRGYYGDLSAATEEYVRPVESSRRPQPSLGRKSKGTVFSKGGVRG
jgi:1-acyl-sn-glycerol-3-phosphate acyltransferase